MCRFRFSTQAFAGDGNIGYQVLSFKTPSRMCLDPNATKQCVTLAHGAELEIKDKLGLTPLKHSYEIRKYEVSAFIARAAKI